MTWGKIASVDLSGGAATTIDTGTYESKFFEFLMCFLYMTTTQIPSFRYNDDSGSNYADRGSNNGAADFTSVSQAAITFANFQTQNQFTIQTLYNISDEEKLGIAYSMSQNSTGATNVPSRQMLSYKWINTSVQRSDVSVGNFLAGSGNYGVDTYLDILGTD